jgi:hypothetical protein
MPNLHHSPSSFLWSSSCLLNHSPCLVFFCCCLVLFLFAVEFKYSPLQHNVLLASRAMTQAASQTHPARCTYRLRFFDTSFDAQLVRFLCCLLSSLLSTTHRQASCLLFFFTFPVLSGVLYSQTPTAVTVHGILVAWKALFLS